MATRKYRKRRGGRKTKRRSSRRKTKRRSRRRSGKRKTRRKRSGGKCPRPCWSGYRRVAGKGCGKGSCKKK